MSNEKKGRTFLTKEEIAQRGGIIDDARNVEQLFFAVGQFVVTAFMKINEAAEKNQELIEKDKAFAELIKENYGDVMITEEGEVLPKSDDKGANNGSPVEDVEVESI